MAVVKKYVTWLQVEYFVAEMVEEYKNKDITGVYGIPRGGLVLAVMLSNRLNVPMLAAPADGCIIVDDICDTGESLLHYQFNSSGGGRRPFELVTLFYKENKLGVVPDHYKYEKGKDWIVFPWEEGPVEGGVIPTCSM